MTNRALLTARGLRPPAPAPTCTGASPAADNEDPLCYGMCCKVRGWCRRWLELEGDQFARPHVFDCRQDVDGVPQWPMFIDIRLEASPQRGRG